MMNPNDLFTFVLKVISPEEKILLVKKGETLISDPEDADFELSTLSDNSEDADIVNKLVLEIPSFQDLEEGEENNVTLTLDELENYGFTLEEAGDLIGEKLDNDQADGTVPGEPKQHVREIPQVEELTVTDEDEDSFKIFEDRELELSDPNGIYVEHILSSLKSRTKNSPIVSIWLPEDEPLQESAQWGDILRKLLAELSVAKSLTPREVKNILSNNEKGSPVSISQFLRLVHSAGNFDFILTNGNQPVMIRKQTYEEPLNIAAFNLFKSQL